jgi:hypothetical protein
MRSLLGLVSGNLGAVCATFKRQMSIVLVVAVFIGAIAAVTESRGAYANDRIGLRIQLITGSPLAIWAMCKKLQPDSVGAFDAEAPIYCMQVTVHPLQCDIYTPEPVTRQALDAEKAICIKTALAYVEPGTDA